MPLYSVTNNRRVGSWSIITAGGTRSVQAGASRDVEMTEAEAENGKADGIDIVKAKARAMMSAGNEGPEMFVPSDKARGVTVNQTITIARDPKPAADVLAMADDKSVKFMTFKSAAAKVLGDDCPAKKDEIVAALKAKAEAE